MASKKQHPENRGDRSPLTSRKMKEQLRKNRFVPKRNAKESSAQAGTEIDLPPGPRPETPAQPQPGDPVPLR